MTGERTPQRFQSVSAALDRGEPIGVICATLDVPKRYVYRVRHALRVVYEVRPVNPEVAAARHALDRAFATFERASNPTTYQALTRAQCDYDDALASADHASHQRHAFAS